MPHPKPSAALDPVSDTAAQTSITKESSLLPMSLDAMASSIPEKSNRTPRMPMGNTPSIRTNELPKRRPSATFAAPKNSTDAPLRPPKRYCPASPPAPWHTGIAPNQQPTRFIAPTLTDTAVAETSCQTEGRLKKVISKSTELLSVSRTEELGFYVLNAVVENLSCEIIAPYLTDIWKPIFVRLQSRRAAKFVNSFVVFMSLFLAKHGSSVLVESIDTLQNGLFLNILQTFWIPNLKLISGATERKLALVAATRLICESLILSDDKYSELWGRMLNSIISLLAQPDQYVELENGEPDLPETVGYSATFARLHYGRKKEADPLKEIRDPKEFFVTLVSRLSSSSPGRYGPVIQTYVDAANQTALLQLCATYNCVIA